MAVKIIEADGGEWIFDGEIRIVSVNVESQPETPEPETVKKQDSESKPSLDYLGKAFAADQTRQEVIDFIAKSNDRFKQNLARELNCSMAEAPNKVADYLGFAEEK